MNGIVNYDGVFCMEDLSIVSICFEDMIIRLILVLFLVYNINVLFVDLFLYGVL